MPRSWRLVDSGFVPTPESAALDEAIVEAHVSGKIPNTLHFYIRSVPTVSVGYFQKIGETVDKEECQRRGVSIVRRRSGGSSIYTDRGQLIYGLVLHESDLPDERAASFRIICQSIADALRSFGIDAVYRPMNDIEVGGRKVSGSAQFRRRGSVLQHGTVIVDTDISQMDAVLKAGSGRRGRLPLPSDRVVTLASLLGRAPDMKEIKDSMISALGKAFDAEFVPSSITDFEKSVVEKLVGERYSRREWNLKF